MSTPRGANLFDHHSFEHISHNLASSFQFFLGDVVGGEGGKEDVRTDRSCMLFLYMPLWKVGTDRSHLFGKNDRKSFNNKNTEESCPPHI